MKKPGTATRPNGSVRCAIYTRKSSEEGLEQEFNSLQAQREACEAFITSQRHEGWMCLPECYDDGGSPTPRWPISRSNTRGDRKRGANTALHVSPLCRTRLGPVVEGRARPPQHPQQVAEEPMGSPARRKAIRANDQRTALGFA